MLTGNLGQLGQKRTLAAALPLCTQQLIGLAFLNTYSSFFFRQAGFDDPFQITAILTGIKIATIFALIPLSEVVGRRPLILFGGFWSTAMLLVVASAGLSPSLSSTPIRNLTIAAACLWSVGSSCREYILVANPNRSLTAEKSATLAGLSSEKLRHNNSALVPQGSQLASACCLVSLSILPSQFSVSFIQHNTSLAGCADKSTVATNGANWGYKTGWLFFGCGLVASVGALFLIPETCKRSPAELDELYQKRVSVWKMRRYVTDVQREQDIHHRQQE